MSHFTELRVEDGLKVVRDHPLDLEVLKLTAEEVGAKVLTSKEVSTVAGAGVTTSVGPQDLVLRFTGVGRDLLLRKTGNAYTPVADLWGSEGSQLRKRWDEFSEKFAVKKVQLAVQYAVTAARRKGLNVKVSATHVDEKTGRVAVRLAVL